MAGTDQWLRKCSVTVMPSSDPNAGTEKGIDLSDFRIRFQTHAIEQLPAWAVIRIYNLAPDTEKKFIKEYNSVVLQAGYQNGKFGIIFQGTIKQYKRGHETVTDSYLDIFVSDGDMSFNFGVVNTSLPAGWTEEQRQKAAIDGLKAAGAQQGYTVSGAAISALGQGARGAVLWGSAAPALSDSNRNAGKTWHYTDNKVNVVPLEGYLPSEEIVLSGATGLVGWPDQTNNGIEATCLLNPAIRLKNLVRIDNKAINYTVAPGPNPWTTSFGTPGPLFLQPVTEDGDYIVLVIEHEGDTRGNPWYTHLICIAVDLTKPGAQTGQTGVDDQNLPLDEPAKSNFSIPSDKPDNDPTSPFYSPPEPAGPPEPIGPPIPQLDLPTPAPPF